MKKILKICNGIFSLFLIWHLFGCSMSNHTHNITVNWEWNENDVFAIFSCDCYEYQEQKLLANVTEKIEKEPTCIEVGNKTITAKVMLNNELYYDEKQFEIPALGHDIVRNNACEANCVDKGWNEYEECSRCDYSTYVEIPATGHIYEIKWEWTKDFDALAVFTCKNDSSHIEKMLASVKHNVDEYSTCTKKGLNKYTATVIFNNITYTNIVYDDIELLAHELEHHNSKSPSCLEIGWSEYDTCENCSYSTYVELPPTGHKYSDIISQPTCTEQGYTTHTCYCGDTYTDTYVEATGHKYDVTIVDAGEVEQGTNTYVCSVCEHTYIEYIDSNMTKILEFTFDSNTDSYYVLGSKFDLLSEITIPDYYNGKKVTKISKYAFEENELLKTINLGTNIEEIEDRAFFLCINLESINFSYNIKIIGDSSFYGCEKLSSVYIPSSVVEVRDGAFWHCYNLSCVVFAENSNTKLIGSHAFSYTSVYGFVAPDHIEVLENLMFMNVNIGYIVLPNTIKEIGSNTFTNTYLTRVYYEGTNDEWNKVSISKISNDNFINAKVMFYSDCIHDDFSWNYDDNGEINTRTDIVQYEEKHPTETEVGHTAYESCIKCDYTTYEEVDTLLKYNMKTDGTYEITGNRITLENSVINIPSIYNDIEVTSIGYRAFCWSSKIVQVNIPNSIKIIDDFAFCDCENLSLVSIEDGVEEIIGSAFQGCKSLTNITIPSSVKSIGCYAFNQCDKLTSITTSNLNFMLPPSLVEITINNIEKIDAHKFKDMSKLETVNLSNNLKEIGESAFSGCNRLSTLNFGELLELECIGSYAFSSCVRLNNLDFSKVKNLVEIGGWAFNNCLSLSSLKLPDSIEIIDFNAFAGCDSLQYNEYDNAYYLGNDNTKYLVLIKVIDSTKSKMSINENTKILYTYSFENCSKLAELNIPSSVTDIGLYTFSGCSNLQLINIPNNIKNIGHNAFENCNSLDFNEFNNGYYLGNDSNETILLFKVIDKTIESFYISESTKFINSSAFYGCNSMKEVSIPEGVINIGHSSFAGCSSLESVRIPNTVKTIENMAFSNCIALESLNLGTGVKSLGQYCFTGTQIRELDLPESLDTIYNAAFYNNEKLETIIIPTSIKWIQDEAFDHCSLIDKVYYMGTSDEWNSILIGDGESFCENDNLYLKQADRYYYSELEPTIKGDYWHFVNDKPVVWE